MTRWSDLLTRLCVVLAVAATAWMIGVPLARIPPPSSLALFLLLAPLGLLVTIRMWTGGYRRTLHVWRDEFPDAGRARVRADGAFEWEPADAPRIAVRHGVVQHWWDTRHAPRVGASLAFDIPDDVPPAALHDATARGLKAARRALPGRGKVRAKAAARDEPGPTSLVRIRLEVQGFGADERWARAAAEAFSSTFMRALERQAYPATPR